MNPIVKETDYELEERAAIREIDGGYQPVYAKILAQQDMLDRRKERQLTARQETEWYPTEVCEGPPEQASGPLPERIDGSEIEQLVDTEVEQLVGGEIEQLIDQRERIRRSIKATDDPQRIKELIEQWQYLCRQIISLKLKG